MSLLFKTLTTCIIFFLFPTVVWAHGGTFSFKYIDGQNLVVVTHNVHDPQSGIPITYNLRLYNMTGQPIQFEKVETEFKHGINTTMKQTLSMSANNDATLVYTFPKQGEYTMVVRFLDNEQQIAKGEFPLVVQKGLDEGPLNDIFSTQTLIAFLFGIVVTKIFLVNPRFKNFPLLQKFRQHKK